MNNRNNFLLGAFFFNIVTIIFFILTAFEDYFDLKIIFAIINAVVIFVGYKAFNNVMHPYMIFIYVFDLFLGSRVFLDILGSGKFYVTDYFTFYEFGWHIQKEMLRALILSLLGLQTGMLCAFVFKTEIKLKTEPTVIKYSIIVMKLCIPFVIYRFFEIIKYVFENGYLALFLEPDLLNSPLSHFVVLYQFSFFAFLSAKPDYNRMKRFVFIYFIIMLATLLGGQRGLFASQLLLLGGYYSLYIGRLKFKNVLLAIVIFVSLFQVISLTRTSGFQDISSSLSLADQQEKTLFESFIYQQGISISVIGYAIQRGITNESEELLYPLWGYIYDKGVDNIKDNHYETYADKIAKYANTNKFEEGMGLSSSYVAELYSFYGLEAVFIGNLVLAFFLIWMIYMKGNSWFGCFMFLVISRHLYIMPRAGYIQFLPDFIKLSLVYVVAVFIMKLLKQEKANKNYL